jgi:hypothetical protein
MMSFIDGVQYPKTSTFSCNQLAAITAEQVATLLNKKAFGTLVPGPEDRPHTMRVSSLAFFKKVISQFMPLRSMPWDNINLCGNPKHSTAVNEVISKVKKFEVRQEGVLSQARCALEWEEFYLLLALVCHLHANSNLWFFYGGVLPAVANHWSN